VDKYGKIIHCWSGKMVSAIAGVTGISL